MHPDLLQLENVLLVPHLGSGTTETRTAMADLAVENVIGGARRPSAADAGGLMTGRSSARPKRRASIAPNVASIMRTLARAIDGLELPAVEKISEESQEEPFQVLIATMLSAQTRDAVTAAASARLFSVARTPQAMAKLTDGADREADLSGQLLPPQGEARESDVPHPRRALRRRACRRRWRSC